MSFSVAEITSIVIVLAVAYSGYYNGLLGAVVTLCVVVFSAILAVNLYAPIARMGFLAGLGWYAVPVCLLVVFVFFLFLLQFLANGIYPPVLTVPKKLNQSSGAIAVFAAGFFMAGFLMITFALLPGTGGPADRQGLLNSDEFFAKAIQSISSWCGSVQFNADEFLVEARKEKVQFQPRDYSRDDPKEEMYNKNNKCWEQLRKVGVAIQDYADQNEGEFPKSPVDLLDYLSGKPSVRNRTIACPLTKQRYGFFPVKNYRDVEGDEDFILVYDVVQAPYGHQLEVQGKRGEFVTKRAVLFAGKRGGEVRKPYPRWVEEEDFTRLLRAQREAMAPAEE